MKEELEKRINAVDLANGGEGKIVIDIEKEVKLEGATMYVVAIGINTASFIVYEDGTLFHQDDWQGGHPEAAEEIEDFDWLTEDGKCAVVLNGLPRVME